MIATRRVFALVAAVVACGALALAASAAAAPIVVNTTADENGTGTDCSLREAIDSANADDASDNGCADGSGTDAITFAGPVVGDINLDTLNGALFPLTDMSITGPGSGLLTINGPTGDRVFTIDGGVQISGLSVEGGSVVAAINAATGGGIANFGDLTLTDVVVANNEVTATAVADDSLAVGAGIYNELGTLTLDNSTVRDNTATATTADAGDFDPIVQGAGIMSFGPLNVSHSTIADNDAVSNDLGVDAGDIARISGAGVFKSSNGLMTIDHSTISGNQSTATSSNGGAQVLGGALLTFNDGTIELSTVAGNNATVSGAESVDVQGGGIWNPGVTLGVFSSTIALNGSGTTSTSANIRGGGTTTLKNAIVAYPQGPGSPTNCVGVVSGGYNISTDNSCSFTGTGDQQPVDPDLDSVLSDNGGPTETLHPEPGSPAIDAGSTDGSMSDTTHDQRDLDRPVFAPDPDVDDGTDIGSVEVQPPAPPTFSDTDPDSPATDVTPLVKGSAPGATSVTLFEDGTDPPCTGIAGTGTATLFETTGIEGSAGTNRTNTFYGTSTNAFGIESLCSSTLLLSGSIAYVHDSIAPQTLIDAGPTDPTDHTPTFTFHGTDANPPLTFMCSVDTGTPSFSTCTSPFTAAALPDGSYTFRVKATDAAGNEDLTPATQAFTLSQPQPVVTPPAAAETGQRAAALKKCKKKKTKKARKKCKKKAKLLPL